MTETALKNLKLARECFREKKELEGLAAYALVLAEESDNGEAKYFGCYTDYQDCLEKMTDVENALLFLGNSLENAIKSIAESEGSLGEKLYAAKAVVDTYTPITNYVVSARISTSSDTIQDGAVTLYWLGSYIENNFSSDPNAMKLAIIPWKEAVAIQKKFYAYKYYGYKAEDYIAKIQQVDPAYIAPQKAGCISKG